MERTIIDMNNIENLVINGDVFIIPNSAAKINEFFEPEKKRELMKSICKMNGVEFNEEKDLCVETWIVSKEFCSDNVADHNIRTVNEDGNIVLIGLNSGRFIPSCLLKDHNEGETIDIKLPIWININRAETAEDTEVTFRLTLAQEKYRYKRFGSFQEVFKAVTS